MKLEQVTILVVDDNDGTRRLMRKLLKDLGVGEVVTVANVEDALKAMHGHHIDAVFTDWEMIGETGLDLIKALQSADHDRFRRLPVVMMTGYSEEWRVQTVRQMGISEFLLKPFSSAQLAAKLKAALRGRSPASDGSDEATITPAALRAAELTFEHLRGDFEAAMDQAVREISTALRVARAMPAERAAACSQIFRLAHNLKGQGSSFGYPLLTEVAAECCDFLRDRVQFTDHDLLLLGGYASALSVVAENRIRGEGGEIGQTLVRRLRGLTGIEKIA